ncbi:MAG: hypothetical protein WA941_19280 [Nitrososphaeraceae archaeon]
MNSSKAERWSSTAFGLSLAAGVLILLGTLLPWTLFAGFQWNPMGHMTGGGGMMGGGGRMGGAGIAWLFPLSLVSGATVLVGAIMMYQRPQQTRMWGIPVLIFSVLALIEMGFSIVGGVLGIIGGIVALSQRDGT